MKKVYKLGVGVLLLIGIVFFIKMCRFAQGVKDDAVNKRNQVNTQDSIKISDSTSLYLEAVKLK
jgi:hypothetical protein